MAVSSNCKRASRRNECRKRLSQHIYRKLGIQIPPDQVRLQPRPQDPYTWSYPSSKRDLFKRCLSQGSVGVYDQICAELDRSIEAVPSYPLSTRCQSNDNDETQSPQPRFQSSPEAEVIDDSFTAQIERLKRTISCLEGELNQANTCSQQEVERRVLVESSLRASTQEVVGWRSAAERYAAEIERVVANLDNMAVSLHAARPNLSHLWSVHGDDTSVAEPDEPLVVHQSCAQDPIQTLGIGAWSRKSLHSQPESAGDDALDNHSRLLSP